MTKGAQVGARRFAAVGLVSGVVGVVLLAGCGQEPAPRPADQPGDGERTTTPSEDNEAADEQARVAWVEGYCRAAAEVVHSASRMPDIDTSTPERTTATSGELLTVMIGGLDSALEGLDELGAADAPEGGEQLRESTIDSYTEVRDHADGAQRELQRNGEDAVGTVRETLDRIGGLDLVGGLDDVPALRQAGAQSDTCVQLTSDGRTSIAPNP